MRVGFTGTQKGLTPRQEKLLRQFFDAYHGKVDEFHHGDCMGADSDAHDIAEEYIGEGKIWIHPPTDPKKRAFRVSRHWCVARPYIERNHEIVDATTVLIACPRTAEEELRSGTWATIRYARKLKRPILLLEPEDA